MFRVLEKFRKIQKKKAKEEDEDEDEEMVFQLKSATLVYQRTLVAWWWWCYRRRRRPLGERKRERERQSVSFRENFLFFFFRIFTLKKNIVVVGRSVPFFFSFSPTNTKNTHTKKEHLWTHNPQKNRDRDFSL